MIPKPDGGERPLGKMLRLIKMWLAGGCRARRP